MWTPRFCSHCSLTRRPHFCSLTHFSSADKTGFLPGSWYVTYTCQAEASRQPRGSIFKRHFCNNNELTIHLQPVSLKGWASYEHAGRSTAIFTGHSLEKSVLIPGVGPAPLLAHSQLRADRSRSQRAVPWCKSDAKGKGGCLIRQHLVCLYQYLGLREAVRMLLKDVWLSVIQISKSPGFYSNSPGRCWYLLDNMAIFWSCCSAKTWACRVLPGAAVNSLQVASWLLFPKDPFGVWRHCRCEPA